MQLSTNTRPSPSDIELLHKAFLNLADIPDSEWEIFQQNISTQSLKSGRFIIKSGGPSDKIVFVCKGVLMAYYTRTDGREIVRNFALENQLACSFMTARQNLPSHINIMAIEDCTLLVFNFQDFLNAYDRHPCWERLGRKLFESYCSAFELRAYQLMALDAKERYLDFLKQYPELNSRIQQKYVAAFLGITPQSMSRLSSERRSDDKYE